MLTKIRSLRKPDHPVLVLGNIAEGFGGIFTVVSLIYTAIMYGATVALVLSIIYVVVVALIAFFSAYHLV